MFSLDYCVIYIEYKWNANHKGHCNCCYHKIKQHNHHHLSSILQIMSLLSNRFSFRDFFLFLFLSFFRILECKLAHEEPSTLEEKMRYFFVILFATVNGSMFFGSVKDEFHQQSIKLKQHFFADALFKLNAWVVCIKNAKMKHIIGRITFVCSKNRLSFSVLCGFCFVCINFTGSNARMNWYFQGIRYEPTQLNHF